MMKKIISLVLLTACALTPLLTSCTGGNSGSTGGDGGKNYVTRSRVVSYTHFNTVSAIYSYGEATEEEFLEYVRIVDETLKYYHKLFDIYYVYAGVKNIANINANAGKMAVEVDRTLIDFLLYCKELFTLTEGKTNVMLGSVLKIWHNAREEANDEDNENYGYLDPSRLPDETALAEAAKHTSIDLLVIDEEASTVYISDPLASIDVGAIAKGYVVEILYDKLVEMGADSVALNIGGNLRTIGKKPGGESWVTGIQNPDKTSDESIKCRVEIGDSSIVTSGDYERYFFSGENKYHHIIDPATQFPADYFASVSILTRDSGLADALSTALFCMSYEDGLALVEAIGGVDVIWIYKDGTMKHTEGISFVGK